MYTFYFDSTIVSNPLNFDELSEKIERVDALRGLFIKVDQTLKFTDDAYAYLFNIKQTNGYCNFVALKIYKTCDNVTKQIFTGNIRISDCKFNLSKCIVECPIEDDSYGARIFNNKNIKTFVDAGTSKNGVTLTKPTNLNLGTIKPSTNNLMIGIRDAYDVFECLEYLVGFMTDGQMGLVSDWYSGLSNGEKICILTGHELRTKNHISSKRPCISFQDLFDELNKKFNLGMGIELINNVWTLRIEPMQYFFDISTSIATPYIPDLLEYIDTYNLYSQIKVGSDKTVAFDLTKHSFPPIRFLAFNEEYYFIQGQCNIDRELDLLSKFVIDSNIIEELIDTNTNNTTYDDDIFMIQYYTDVASQNWTAVWNDIITQPPVFFNQSLNNANVTYRWDVQGAIAQFLNAVDQRFFASSTTALPNTQNFDILGTQTFAPAIEPFAFQDDSTPPNYDNGGYYNNTPGNYSFTAYANGVYTFRVRLKYKWSGPFTVSGGGNQQLRMGFSVKAKVYAGVTLARQYEQKTPGKVAIYQNPTTAYLLVNGIPKYLPLTFDETVYLQVFMNGGEKVDLNIGYDWTYLSGYPDNPFNYLPAYGVVGSFYYQFLSGCEFACETLADGGGIYKGSDPEAYKVSLFKYDYPISDDDWTTLKNNPAQTITFGMDNATKGGWIKNMDRNTTTGMASIELISNINNTQ